MECPVTPPHLPEGGIPSPEPVKMKNDETTALPRSGSPEPNCTICLGPLTDRSNTDICAHKFCFTCIHTWSKVKSECPLCKQKFSMIYHEFKEDGSHSVYTVPRPPPEPGLDGGELHGNYFMVVNMPNMGMGEIPILPVPFMRRNLNRHRLPQASAFSRFRRLTIPRPTALQPVDPQPPARSTRSHTRLFALRPDAAEGPISSGIERRRQIYALNQWALPLPDLTGRTRECSVAFFRENPAVTHRLTAWILRDLSVLLSETRIYEASARINDMLMQHDLRSPEFSNEVRHFLGDRTRHFMHELISFSRSPYDMIGYDRSVSYGNWDPTLESYLRHSNPTDTSNDEDIVEVHVERAQPSTAYPSMRERLNFYRQRDSDRWGRIYARLRSIQDYTARAGEILNPFPMPSPSSAFTAFGAVVPSTAPLPNVLAPPSMTVQPIPGPSGLSRAAPSPPVAITLDSSDEDDAPVPQAAPEAAVQSDDEIEVVGEFKGRRTPEVIDLNSDAETPPPEEEVDELLTAEDIWGTPSSNSRDESNEQINLDVSDLLMLPQAHSPIRAPTPPDAPQEFKPDTSIIEVKCKKRKEKPDSLSPKRKKHKKSKHHKLKKPSSYSHIYHGLVSSDDESKDPLEFVPPRIPPRAFSPNESSDEDQPAPRVRSSVVVPSPVSWGTVASTSHDP